MSTHNLVGILVTGTLLGCLLSAPGVAADPSPTEKNQATASAAQHLLQQDLPQIPGKEVVMLTVTAPPGAAGPPHRHNAEVFVYMLEGTMVMQVDGQAPVTLKPGQTFHEAPGDIHRRSQNPSATEPAKFLVFMIKDKGTPVTVPVPHNP